jgi:hypothetical protein
MTNQKPIDEIRIGRITASIWKNATSKGDFYNVTFSRLYKDGDDWRRSDSFGRDDLLLLAKLADAAHSRIYDLQADRTEEEAEAA